MFSPKTRAMSKLLVTHLNLKLHNCSNVTLHLRNGGVEVAATQARSEVHQQEHVQPEDESDELLNSISKLNLKLHNCSKVTLHLRNGGVEVAAAQARGEVHQQEDVQPKDESDEKLLVAVEAVELNVGVGAHGDDDVEEEA
eukprot:TRINITY_DN1298_c0_g1_i3.p1 TRINITY_DN1298_c0_g1~~TRINITY_DN1298_c0_g1_i3.p1  ORF type:complete len:141 (+),score=15.55 TRINITY_DN1298_c0_g1_i3:2123-2545(+)